MIAAMPSREYERFAGACALLVAAVGVAYSLTFVIVVADEPKWAQVANAVFLLSGGLLAVAVLIAVYARLRETEPSFALLALVLGLAGGLGSAIHGAQDFAFEVRREGSIDTGISAIDPRGFLTFAVSGLAFLLVGWLVRRSAVFPRRLGDLSLVAGGLLVVVYLGRLVLFDPDNALLLAIAAVTGFVVTPALYAWLGLILRRGAAPPSP
jgi:hypothetical protein